MTSLFDNKAEYGKLSNTSDGRNDLKTGRELDIEVAQKVFGFFDFMFVPAYSTDANTCALVKAKIMELGEYRLSIELERGQCSVSIWKRYHASMPEQDKFYCVSHEVGATECEAVCLAALKAGEVKDA